MFCRLVTESITCGYLIIRSLLQTVRFFFADTGFHALDRQKQTIEQKPYPTNSWRWRVVARPGATKLFSTLRLRDRQLKRAELEPGLITAQSQPSGWLCLRLLRVLAPRICALLPDLTILVLDLHGTAARTNSPLKPSALRGVTFRVERLYQPVRLMVSEIPRVLLFIFSRVNFGSLAIALHPR
jgi:hypothetical protein